ncbi:nuclear protein MDM1 isoform X1 [Sphaerodactylus townsendi]|uniref:nuclear protein MDM1 isoform X1 n=1 Tax=Sphaerodactylus townsendi TaxID=933632 RepID=UPI0020270253|nr:nuclear protein MDM1 isoform X1 [Sphaerodactylus townsendi]
MPVKGLSEYRRNFKWKKADQSKLCIPMHEQKCQWAGLRSDQLGIAREPNFISKRRVPYYSTQISKSFEWNRDNDCEKLSECEAPPPVELHTNHSKDDAIQENIKTPDAPRLPEKMHPNSASSRPEPTEVLSENKKKLSPKTPAHENGILAPTEKDLGKIDNGLKRVLQRKAGMNILRSSSFPRSSEYQRQFIWKTPQKISPILAADQVIHNASKSIPPYKSPAIIPETEYERCFKASPPMKELKEKSHLEEKEHPIFDPAESSPGEKKEKKESLSKIQDLPKESKSETEQKQKHKPHCLHGSFRNMNTEYRSKFLSPTQYIYKDGAWLRIRRNIPSQGSRNTLNYMWYMEVKELREKAETYRQRIRGTHFSRDHLNQILSDNNRLWDLSSESSTEEAISNNVRALDLAGVSEKQISPGPKALPQPEMSEQLTKYNTEKLGLSDAVTVPVKRRLVWGEPSTPEKLEDLPLEEGEEKSNKQELEKFEKGNSKDSNINNQQVVNVSLVSPSGVNSDCSSVSSRKGGRVSTPELRVLGGAQRTHHDLTTPAAGGAVLVSPPKIKASSSVQIKKRPSDNPDEIKAALLPSSSAAGIKPQDTSLLQKDQSPRLALCCTRNPPTTIHSQHTPIVPALKTAKDSASSYWSPSRRIQGTLRDPEFQHNGNVASPKRSWLQLPLQERNYNDEDDRLSQISARSAASSSLASQVLERARRRKENFWGKM